VLVRRYLLEGPAERQTNGLPAAGINEISMHGLVGPQPGLISLVRHDLKANGLVTITEHFDRSIAMAFNEALQ